MKYYTRMLTEETTSEITKEQARFYLEGAYIKEHVSYVIDEEKSFRLKTPYRVIWTKTDNGLVPMAGFYGVCE